MSAGHFSVVMLVRQPVMWSITHTQKHLFSALCCVECSQVTHWLLGLYAISLNCSWWNEWIAFKNIVIHKFINVFIVVSIFDAALLEVLAQNGSYTRGATIKLNNFWLLDCFFPILVFKEAESCWSCHKNNIYICQGGKHRSLDRKPNLYLYKLSLYKHM